MSSIYLLLSSCFLFLSRNLLLSSSNSSFSSTSILSSRLEIDLHLALGLDIDLDLDPALGLKIDLDPALGLDIDLALALGLEIDLDPALSLGRARKLPDRSWTSSSTLCSSRLLGLLPDLVGVFKAFLSDLNSKLHNVKSGIFETKAKTI